MPENDVYKGFLAPVDTSTGQGSENRNIAVEAFSFIVPAPIKYTVLPLAQLFGGFALDHIQKRKAVNSFLSANPTLSRADARKVVLGGVEAAKVIGKRMERPVSTYTVSQVFDTMVNDGSVSSGNPINNTFEFVSDAGQSIINLLQETPPKLPSSDRIPACLVKPPDLTFGVVDSQDIFPACVNMQGKVFNISMNESTYYKICRRFRMGLGASIVILVFLISYLIFRTVKSILESRRRKKARLAYYSNLQRVPESIYSRSRIALPPKKENNFL